MIVLINILGFDEKFFAWRHSLVSAHNSPQNYHKLTVFPTLSVKKHKKS